jgi:hypothetical protein
MSLAFIAVPAPATAVTHAPCKHHAGTPYVDYVNDSVVTCKVEAVSLAVLRHRERRRDSNRQPALLVRRRQLGRRVNVQPDQGVEPLLALCTIGWVHRSAGSVSCRAVAGAADGRRQRTIRTAWPNCVVLRRRRLPLRRAGWRNSRDASESGFSAVCRSTRR